MNIKQSQAPEERHIHKTDKSQRKLSSGGAAQTNHYFYIDISYYAYNYIFDHISILDLKNDAYFT